MTTTPAIPRPSDPFAAIPDPSREYEGTVLELPAPDTAPVLVCASCARPVERTFDDDFQHVTVDDGLACTTWPVLPVRAAAKEAGR